MGPSPAARAAPGAGAASGQPWRHWRRRHSGRQQYYRQQRKHCGRRWRCRRRGRGRSSTGAGGAGGVGISDEGGSTISNTNTGTITGGAGGIGAAQPGSAAGQGGAGGAGVFVNFGNTTITNSGAISGGRGGSGGAGDTGGTGGTGGAAIFGANVTVINSGTLTAGNGGAGGTGTSTNGAAGVAGNAITFGNIPFGGATDSGSVLEIRQGSTITGNVVSQNNNATLRLGGATNSSFDVSGIGPAAQYQGFVTFVKTGTSTWTLSNTTTQVTPWTSESGHAVDLRRQQPRRGGRRPHIRRRHPAMERRLQLGAQHHAE